MLALLATGCSNDELTETTSTKSGQLIATMEAEQANSRVGFEHPDGTFFWTSSDVLGVGTSSFSAFNITSGAGEASASFSGSTSENLTYAVYPYNANTQNHTISGTQLTYVLPASYTYNKVDAGLPTSATTDKAATNSFNAPMYGAITNGSVEMKHLGGVFCIVIESMPVASGTLTFSADQKISGSFTANLTETNPEIKTTTEQNEDNKKVSIEFSNATQGSPAVFYIPAPTGDYTNLRATITASSQTEADASCGSYTISRRSLKVLTLSESTIDATNVNSLQNLDLANHNSVVVEGEVSGNQSISIPTISGEDSSASISLQDVNTENQTTLTVTEQSTDNSVDNLTLSIPNSESTENALNVDIQMPSTTVTLSSNSGKATYGTITASTADNTLIINAGVTVKKVVIKKGNILVKSDATLTEAELSGISSAIIYKEEGATIPTSLPFGITTASYAEYELRKAATAASAATYQMTEEIAISSPIVVSNPDFTLDLNGKALKADGALTAPAGLTTTDAVVVVRRGGKLTVQDTAGNGSIDGTAGQVMVGVKLTDKNDGASGDNASLVVEGGTIKGYNYGISGNGTRHGTEITVSGGTITAEGATSDSGDGPTAIYHPQEGTLTISGGNIKGDVGIELRSGTLNISGGTVEATGTFSAKEGGNSNGTTMNGAAVAVSQHTTNKAISVNISNQATLKGDYALYEEDLQDENVSNITMSVTGGTLTGKVFSENCTEFITGGTFSDLSAVKYLGSNANATVALAEDTEITAPVNITKGTVIIDLGEHALTTNISSTGDRASKSAFTAANGSTITIQNGTIGTDDGDVSLSCAVWGYKGSTVNLENIKVGAKTTYAYNSEGGAGKLNAKNCTFQGWMSGWNEGGTFENCTFTKGKQWFPAAICYGNTTFSGCTFYKLSTGGVLHESEWETNKKQDENGYYNYNYVIDACSPAQTITLTNCKFINESGTESNVTTDSHPIHNCGWGDGTEAQPTCTINGTQVKVTCSD